MHNIHDCDADIPTLLRVSPSKINSKESLDDGVDLLSCVRRSAECVASAASIALDDTSWSVCDGLSANYGHAESRI